MIVDTEIYPGVTMPVYSEDDVDDEEDDKDDEETEKDDPGEDEEEESF